MAVHLRIKGYSDKIFEFAKIYIDLILESAEEGSFSREVTRQSIEKVKTEYANSDASVDSKSTANRILMLIPHTFHDRLMVKALQK